MAGEAPKSTPPVPSKSPALADEATDLKALRGAVVDAAAVSAGLWFSYIFMLLYLLIAVGGVTHRNLFLEDPVKLPFLGIDLPLVGFFVLAPGLFLIVHAYVLLHFVLFAGKVGVFDSELQAQISDEEVRAQLRWQLPSNIFVQILAGTRDVRRGFTGCLLRLIAQVSFVAGPLALLMLFQIQFLPYHPRPAIALWLRVTVLIDLVLLWMLWPAVARGKLTWIAWRDFHRARIVPAALVRLVRALWLALWVRPDDKPVWIYWCVLRRVARRGTVVAAAIASLVPVLLVFAISTYPDEWLCIQLRSVPVLWTVPALLFDRQPNGWFSDRLVLADQSFVDVDKLDKVNVSRSFRRRDLRQAILDRTDLRKADFIGAVLNDASFVGANLQNALLGCTPVYLHEKTCAQLQGARFDLAKLQGVDLQRAQLQGTTFIGAELQGVDLKRAQLQGAQLTYARLEGTRFEEAQLQGADLKRAELLGADLQRAQLQGADLWQAQLQGTDLREAQLQGVNLDEAPLRGATFANASVWRLHGDFRIDLTDFYRCDPDTMPWRGSNNAQFITWRDSILMRVSANEYNAMRVLKIPPGEARSRAREAARECD
jgi:uncharacterized protein YjbI with pentapeptide repeats